MLFESTWNCLFLVCCWWYSLKDIEVRVLFVQNGIFKAVSWLLWTPAHGHLAFRARGYKTKTQRSLWSSLFVKFLIEQLWFWSQFSGPNSAFSNFSLTYLNSLTYLTSHICSSAWDTSQFIHWRSKASSLITALSHCQKLSKCENTSQNIVKVALSFAYSTFAMVVSDTVSELVQRNCQRIVFHSVYTR